jgi:hypothetical protein
VSFASSGVCQGSGNAVYFNGSSFIDLDTNHMILSFPVSFTYWIKRANLSNIERVFSTNNGAGGYSGFHSQILPNGTIEVFFGTVAGLPYLTEGAPIQTHLNPSVNGFIVPLLFIVPPVQVYIPMEYYWERTLLEVAEVYTKTQVEQVLWEDY